MLLGLALFAVSVWRWDRGEIMAIAGIGAGALLMWIGDRLGAKL